MTLNGYLTNQRAALTPRDPDRKWPRISAPGPEVIGKWSGTSRDIFGKSSEHLRKSSGTPLIIVGTTSEIFGKSSETPQKSSFFPRKPLGTPQNPFGTFLGKSSSSLGKKKEMSPRRLELGTSGVPSQHSLHWTTASHTLQDKQI